MMTRTTAFPAGEPDSLAEAVEGLTFTQGSPSMENGPITMIKPLVEWLEMDWGNERHRLQQNAFLSASVVYMARPGGGNVYDGLCLPTRLVYGWAAGLDARNVKDIRRRNILLDFQRACYQVIAESSVALNAPRGGLVA